MQKFYCYKSSSFVWTPKKTWIWDHPELGSGLMTWYSSHGHKTWRRRYYCAPSGAPIKHNSECFIYFFKSGSSFSLEFACVLFRNHTSEWFLQRWLRRKEEHEGAPIVVCAIIPPSLELATLSSEDDCNAVLGFWALNHRSDQSRGYAPGLCKITFCSGTWGNTWNPQCKARRCAITGLSTVFCGELPCIAH